MIKDVKDKLTFIVDFLKNYDVKLSSTMSDGRINSILNEWEIINLIEQKFKISVPSARDWADFYIDNVPVNIKITTTNTADNASSKKGLYYALTGMIYQGRDQWDQYLKSLKLNIRDTDKDYYFLVVNKDNTSDIFFNSLKCITTLQPNGNNLPFQIKWKDNKILNCKNFEEASRLLLTTLGKSLKLRANAYLYFKKYFNEYL